MLESQHAGDLSAVRNHTEELIKSATDADRPVLVEAPPSSGKTTSAIALAKEIETPLTYLSARTDLYKQAEEECKEYEDVSYETIPSPHRNCDSFAEDSDTADKVKQLYAKGFSGRQIHRQFSEYTECGQSCEYMEKLNRIADDIESIDVLIGNHAHANRQQYIFERLVILDEFNADPFLQSYPDHSSSVTDAPGEIIPGFLSDVSKENETFPADRFQDVADLRQQLTWSRDWSDGIEWFINNGASRSDAHELDSFNPSLERTDRSNAYAPFLAFSLLCMSRVGPGIDLAPPPDGCLDEVWKDAGLNLATKCLRDRNTGEMFKFEAPNLSVAEQVIGLDGTPTIELWNLLAPEEGFKHQKVIPREAFLTYLESAMNMTLIQMADAIHYYAAGRISDLDYSRFSMVKEREDSQFALISPKRALEEYDTRGWLEKFVKSADTAERPASGEDTDSKLYNGYRALNYGNMKSSNVFEREPLGVVAGIPYPGHGIVKRWAGLCGEPARVLTDDDTDEFVFDGFANKIYQHFSAAQALQAVLRFGRHDDIQQDDGATVYISTTALPDWLDVSRQISVNGETYANEAIVVAKLAEIATTADRPGLAAVTIPTLHERIAADDQLPSIEERTVRNVVDKLRSRNYIDVREDAGKHMADLVELTAEVELNKLDEDDSGHLLCVGDDAYHFDTKLDTKS